MDNELKSRRSFASRLMIMLADRNMTQSNLAKMTDISEPTISRYAHAKTAVNMHNVRKIAEALKCGVEDLIDVGN